jgi:hypothetical protein
MRGGGIVIAPADETSCCETNGCTHKPDFFQCDKISALVESFALLRGCRLQPLLSGAFVRRIRRVDARGERDQRRKRQSSAEKNQAQLRRSLSCLRACAHVVSSLLFFFLTRRLLLLFCSTEQTCLLKVVKKSALSDGVVWCIGSSLRFSAWVGVLLDLVQGRLRLVERVRGAAGVAGWTVSVWSFI